MRKMKPKIKKGSEEGVTGRFRRRQSNPINFIRRKEKPPWKCEDTKNNVFDLVPQGQAKLFTNSLKDLYYICGIKFQKNGSDLQYTVNNILMPTLSEPTYPAC